MKKLITALMVFILCACCLAETGYKGTAWYYSQLTFDKNGEKLSPEEKQLWEDELVKVKGKILGEYEYYYYYFTTGYLYNVGYVVPKAKTDLIKSKYNKLVYTSEMVTLDFYLKETERESEYKKYKKLEEQFLIKEFMKHAEVLEVAFTDYSERIEPNTTPGNIILSIYDYNDDTRVYIYENIIKDKTIVVYVPHEQDY